MLGSPCSPPLATSLLAHVPPSVTSSRASGLLHYSIHHHHRSLSAPCAPLVRQRRPPARRTHTSAAGRCAASDVHLLVTKSRLDIAGNHGLASPPSRARHRHGTCRANMTRASLRTRRGGGGGGGDGSGSGGDDGGDGVGPHAEKLRLAIRSEIILFWVASSSFIASDSWRNAETSRRSSAT